MPESFTLSTVPIVFGAVIACMIYAVGHISGAHFNPAVTLAFALARHFPRREVLPYFLAQFGASIAAVLLLHVLLPPGTSFGATMPKLGVLHSLLFEIVLSFFLMFVIIAVATDTRAKGVMAGFAIGGIVMVCAFLGGPLSGASMNPARSLGPAIFENRLADLWIYFVGPFAGTALAAVTYKWIGVCSSDAKGCC